MSISCLFRSLYDAESIAKESQDKENITYV